MTQHDLDQPEQHLRDLLDSSTRDVVGGPDLAGVIRAGRHGRRRRTTGVAAASVAALAVGGTVLGLSFAGGSTDTGLAVASQPSASTAPSTPAATSPAASPSGPPADGDYVAGTRIDEKLAAVIASHLPSLDVADDVYPSDFFHKGPMPDADWANATDWEATYTVSPDEQLIVVMSYHDPYEESGEPCPPNSGVEPCTVKPVPGGTLVHQSFGLGNGSYGFTTYFESTDGFVVNAIETVEGSSLQNAQGKRPLDVGHLEALVTDDRMAFPEPVVAPTPPPSS